MKVKEGIKLQQRLQRGYALAVEVLARADPNMYMAGLYDNRKSVHIRTPDQVPTDGIGMSNYFVPQNPMCLIPQSGTDAQGRRCNRPAIYGKVAIYSEINPEWLCALVNSNLAEDGVTIRPKRVQDL